MIEIVRGTNLDRKVWRFNAIWESSFLDTSIKVRLLYYGEETRASTRHKWRGDFWDHSDERRYHSKITRPTEIPVDVLADVFRAIREIPVDVYVGFFSADCLLHTQKSGKGGP